MFGSYLQGAIGLVIGIAGSIIGFGALLVTILSPNEGSFFWVLIGFGVAIGGGYMRYLSRQTIRIGDSAINNLGDRETNSQLKSNSVQANQSYSQTNTKNRLNENIIFDGEKNLENNSYPLYLVKKYKIDKNNVLNKYVLSDKTYETIIDCLKIADQIEKKQDKVASSRIGDPI